MLHERAGIGSCGGYHLDKNFEVVIGKVERFHIYSYNSEA